MKTVMKGTEVKRVTNEEASKMVDQGWKYCSKFTPTALADNSNMKPVIGLKVTAADKVNHTLDSVKKLPV